MQVPQANTEAGRSPRWGLWALLYAAVVLYASTVVGPGGFHYLPQDPDRALARFLSMGLGNIASDQRADGMGNLVMMIPFGFLVAAAIVPARGVVWRCLAAIVALTLCITYILAVKYVQLFFPRTVNLYYVSAQTIGATLGVLAHLLAYGLMRRARREIFAASQHGLAWLLTAYALCVAIFMLAPFDVILTREDLAERLASLPVGLLALPGAGRPIYQKMLVQIGNVALLAPVGALLHIWRPHDSLARIFLRGLGLLLAANLLSLGFLSTAPSLIALVPRTCGIILGAVAMRWLAVQDLAAWRRYLPWLALVALLPYLAVVAFANGLVRVHWRTPEEARAALDTRMLLPLWSHYIVSKAQAIKSVAAHMAIYAPVGAILWAWFGHGRAVRVLAAVLAFGLAIAVELGRALAPGLAADFNNAVIAAVAAALAVQGTRVLWLMLETLPRPAPKIVRTWNKTQQAGDKAGQRG